MSDTSQNNGTRTINQSVIEIPTPVRLDIPGETQKKNECSPSKSRRSDWFGKAEKDAIRYGSAQFGGMTYTGLNNTDIPLEVFPVSSCS
jgi:hypothetical protein